MSENLNGATSNLPKVLVAQQLTASEATVYQVSAGTAVAIATATLCNTSGSSRTVSLSVVKTGGTAGVANRVAIITLEASESCVVEELVGLLLGPGDFVSGLASAAAAVTITLTGAVSS
jgi:hypothetical protein